MDEPRISKDLELSSCDAIHILSQYLARRTKKSREKTSFNINGALAEIRTEHFLNTSLEHYHLNIPPRLLNNIYNILHLHWESFDYVLNTLPVFIRRYEIQGLFFL
jgi:hypothetical protein